MPSYDALADDGIRLDASGVRPLYLQALAPSSTQAYLPAVSQQEAVRAMKAASIIGLFLEALLFGVFAMTYWRGTSLLLCNDQSREHRKRNRFFLGANSLMLIACAAVRGPCFWLLLLWVVSPKSSCSIFASPSSSQCFSSSRKETRWMRLSDPASIHVLL